MVSFPIRRKESMKLGKDLNGKELGEGICQRKDGAYIGRFTNRFGVRKTVYGATVAAVKRKLKVAINEDYQKKNVKKEYTLDEWFDIWLEVYKAHIRYSTRVIYKSCYVNHIQPVLGKELIANITTLQLQKFFNQIVNNGYSRSMCEGIRTVVGSLFKYALADDFITSSPMKNVVLHFDSLPGRQSKEALTKEQEDLLIKYSGRSSYANAILIQLSTGLRVGELMALDAEKDIDLENRRIFVRHTLVHHGVKFNEDDKIEFVIGPPKTKYSARTIKFDSGCEKAIRDQLMVREKILKEKEKDIEPQFRSLLFLSRSGSPVGIHMYNNALYKIVKRIRKNGYDFPNITSHSCRHTYATRCFEAGVEPKVVQKLMGHGSLQMTMDIYTHVTDEIEDREMEKLFKYKS